MSKTFWMFLCAGIAIVAAAIGLVFVGTEKNHLDLTGSVLKTRVLSVEPEACFVVADFRIKNPSNVPFVVKDIELILDPASGDPVHGHITSKAEVSKIFEYQKLIGPKFNDVLGLGDKVKGGQAGDFMVAARFELSEAAVNARKAIHVRILDLDGAVSVLNGQ